MLYSKTFSKNKAKVHFKRIRKKHHKVCSPYGKILFSLLQYLRKFLLESSKNTSFLFDDQINNEWQTKEKKSFDSSRVGKLWRFVWLNLFVGFYMSDKDLFWFKNRWELWGFYCNVLSSKVSWNHFSTFPPNLGKNLIKTLPIINRQFTNPTKNHPNFSNPILRVSALKCPNISASRFT